MSQNKNLNRGRSYIDSPDWIKNEKATINPSNKKDSKCFQYAVTVALNYEEIKKDPQRIAKTFSSEKDDQEKSEKNIVTIALNVFYAKKETIYPAYVSKYNSNREKQVILLMISNRKKWHY